MPLVSVIIPTYNSSFYIEETVRAILDQTLQDFEIIVVDDCSTDDTLKKLAAIGDPRIKVTVNEENKGIAYTHNELIKRCTGKYIAIQDHDDISYPHRLKVQSDYLNNHPELIATASYADYIDENGNTIHHPFLRKLLRILHLNNSYIGDKDIFAHLLFKNPFCHSTVMLNRENLGDLRYQAQYRICDDYDLLFRISEKSDIKIHSTPVLKYRFHTSNTSSRRFREKEAEVNNIQGRYISQLGIDPVAEVLYIHNGYFNDTGYVHSIEYLEKSIAWYKEVITRNNHAGIFDHASLLRAIEHNWFERCYLSRKAGFKVLRLYNKHRFITKKPLQRLGKLMALGVAIGFFSPGTETTKN